jgi:hypothetical protein
VVQECASRSSDRIGLTHQRACLRKEVPDDEPIVMVDLLNSTPEPDGTIEALLMLRVHPQAYGGACLARLPGGRRLHLAQPGRRA